MRRSNSKIKQWLLKEGYKNIHFFPHTRFVKDVNIDEVDFDGIASYNDKLVLFQCKSNLKPSKKTMLLYGALSKKYGAICLYLSNFDRKGVTCFK